MNWRAFAYRALAMCLVGVWVGSLPAAAQVEQPETDFSAGLFDDLGPAGLGAGGLAPGPKLVTLQAQFTDPTPDRPARLFITARIEPPWYTYSITQPPGGPKRTVIEVDRAEAFELLGDFQASPPPETKIDPVFDNLAVQSHHGGVTWYAPIEIKPWADKDTLRITGRVNAQLCNSQTSSCLPPEDYPFTAALGPGIEPFKKTVAPPAVGPQEVDPAKLAMQLGLAFLGGVILNLMPCVLPVISLKILSFLEQSGESRARVLSLNLWYSAGLLSVFMVLATLTALAGRAWGEMFTLLWFKVTMTGLVFVMALSFLGVWEIPIPGFVGSGGAGRLQAKEGADGAFFKGVFATILATPCSGPLLGPVIGYLLRQPPYAVYLVFGAIGLGMASPYLIVGAFPGLIRRLPKPGLWMEAVRQLMAFLLLGTVVYLFTTLRAEYFIPTLTLLIGLWFACWWIGRAGPLASSARRATAWLGGSLSAAAIGLFAFTVLLYESKIPWQPFSPGALAHARAEGKTVMVDFTANWCPTCKLNLKFAIDTEDVQELIAENDVVPLLADWTDESPVIKQTLNDLGRNSLPVLAVWPAGSSDDEVIVLTDLVWKSEVLEALRTAGPSQEQSTPAPSRDP